MTGREYNDRVNCCCWGWGRIGRKFPILLCLHFVTGVYLSIYIYVMKISQSSRSLHFSPWHLYCWILRQCIIPKINIYSELCCLQSTFTDKITSKSHTIPVRLSQFYRWEHRSTEGKSGSALCLRAGGWYSGMRSLGSPAPVPGTLPALPANGCSAPAKARIKWCCLRSSLVQGKNQDTWAWLRKLRGEERRAEWGKVRSLVENRDSKGVVKDKSMSECLVIKCIGHQGFPDGASGKEPACQSRRHKRHGFDPQVGKIPWRRAWQLTPVFLPGESHGQKSLVGSSP